jgi:hypothetical protein
VALRIFHTFGKTTFATLSAHLGHAAMSDICPLSDQKRASGNGFATTCEGDLDWPDIEREMPARPIDRGPIDDIQLGPPGPSFV